MSNIIVCNGDVIQPAIISGRAAPGMAQCSVDWIVVPYVQPTDSTAIYSQLVALNEFDPAVTALIVSGCLVLFIIGFSAGMVLKRLRTV